jgi:hypothetical protein
MAAARVLAGPVRSAAEQIATSLTPPQRPISRAASRGSTTRHWQNDAKARSCRRSTPHSATASRSPARRGIGDDVFGTRGEPYGFIRGKTLRRDEPQLLEAHGLHGARRGDRCCPGCAVRTRTMRIGHALVF